MSRLLSPDEVTRQLVDLAHWSRTDTDPPAITASFTLGGFPAAIAFVVKVARVAEEMDHHPDIDVRWDTVTLVFSTHYRGGLTQLDIEAAHRADELFADA